MTVQTISAQNKIRAIMAEALRISALLCANGSLMQTFLSVTGFSEKQIYFCSSLFQAVNVLTILLCARFADKGDVLKRSAVSQFPGAVLFLFYLPLCLITEVTATAYVWLLLISLLQSVSFALHAICEYKVPYYIYRLNEYGTVISVCGILSSGVTFGVGMLISFFSVRYSYNRIMLFAFGISCILLILACVLQYFQKSLITTEEVECITEKPSANEKIPLMTMFRHEAFSGLLIGNITRGFASGTTTILAAAALSIGYDETMTSAMVSAASVANLGACMLFAVLARRLHPRYGILIGSLCFLVLPILLIREQPILYLILYAVLIFGRTLIDSAVPAALLYAVPVEIAGTYNAWRLILHNGSSLLATMLAGFLPLPVLLVLSLVCQLISAVNFCTARVMNSNRAHILS